MSLSGSTRVEKKLKKLLTLTRMKKIVTLKMKTNKLSFVISNVEE